MSEKVAASEKKVQKAERDATESKYSAASVLKKSQEEQSESSAKKKQDAAAKKIQDSISPSPDSDTEAAAEIKLDSKIATEKSAVSDIQGKLKALKAKISTPLLASVNAKADKTETPAPTR